MISTQILLRRKKIRGQLKKINLPLLFGFQSSLPLPATSFIVLVKLAQDSSSGVNLIFLIMYLGWMWGLEAERLPRSYGSRRIMGSARIEQSNIRSVQFMQSYYIEQILCLRLRRVSTLLSRPTTSQSVLNVVLCPSVRRTGLGGSLNTLFPENRCLGSKYSGWPISLREGSLTKYGAMMPRSLVRVSG